MVNEVLPTHIPIFPLPNIVLFPNVFLPLHIFESRYRDLTRDILAGDRIIGMVLLREGWDRTVDPNPPIYPVGCAGLVTHVETLTDGRYNIVLRGVERFRIQNEDQTHTYRRANVNFMTEQITAEDRIQLRINRQRLEQLLDQPLFTAASKSKLPPDIPDNYLINALAQHLEFEPIEKQALLERNGACERCQALIELLEMRQLLRSLPMPQCGLQ